MLEGYYLTLTIVIILQTVTVYGISCFQCSLRANNGIVRTCSDFNSSAHFQVDCPYSTFCMKKTFTLTLQNRNVMVETRDCASQKDLTQVPINGAMQWETIIVDGIYENGCKWRDNSQKDKINTEEICYCDRNLCNGQAKKETTAFNDLLGVMLVFNAMKYVRSFQ